jgi:plasmid stabilization system protein ParE
MKYKLIITERAEELLDRILYYIMNKLKNPQAAGNLINEIEHVYDNIEYNPRMFAYSEDDYLKSKGYRKAVVSRYDYVIVFRIDEESKSVYIIGYFHSLEFYRNKL